MEQRKPDSRKLCALLFVIITILQTAFLIGVFTLKKTGYHEDEFFTYGLSNSYMHPYLYGSDLQVTDNYDVWMTGDDFKYYIRTNSDTKFRYDSVWYNQAKDTNPPLHYAIIHTISSVMCEKFSWWYAFAVNLVCFWVFQLCFYLLNIQICRSRKAALAVCAFYGFTLAGQGLFLFLRLYAMLAMFTVLYTVCSFRLFRAEPFRLRDGLAVAGAALGGALTQHLFLPFAFFITALECVYFLLKKEWKKMWGYGLSAAAGIGLSFAVFPQAFQHIFHSRFQYSKEPDFRAQVPKLASDALKSLTGTTVRRIWSVFTLYVIPVLIIAAVFIPVLFLFRKKISALLAARKTEQPRRKSGIRPECWILPVSAAACFLIISGKFLYAEFGDDSIRYIYHLIPLFLSFFAWIGCCICRLPRRRIAKLLCGGLCLAVLCASGIVQNLRYDPQYVIDAELDRGRISEYTAGQNCILLNNSSVYLPIYCQMLEDAGDIYGTLLEEDHYRKPELIPEYQKLFDRNEPFILVFDVTILFDDDFYDSPSEDDSFDALLKPAMLEKYGDHWTRKEIVSYFEQLSGYTAEYCTAETSHLNQIEAYRFTPKKT